MMKLEFHRRGSKSEVLVKKWGHLGQKEGYELVEILALGTLPKLPKLKLDCLIAHKVTHTDGDFNAATIALISKLHEIDYPREWATLILSTLLLQYELLAYRGTVFVLCGRKSKRQIAYRWHRAASLRLTEIKFAVPSFPTPDLIRTLNKSTRLTEVEVIDL